MPESIMIQANQESSMPESTGINEFTGNQTTVNANASIKAGNLNVGTGGISAGNGSYKIGTDGKNVNVAKGNATVSKGSDNTTVGVPLFEYHTDTQTGNQGAIKYGNTIYPTNITSTTTAITVSGIQNYLQTTVVSGLSGIPISTSTVKGTNLNFNLSRSIGIGDAGIQIVIPLDKSIIH